MDFAEFFGGIGLMRIGLERAGWRIAFANDIDEDTWRRLSAQMPAPRPVSNVTYPKPPRRRVER